MLLNRLYVGSVCLVAVAIGYPTRYSNLAVGVMLFFWLLLLVDKIIRYRQEHVFWKSLRWVMVSRSPIDREDDSGLYFGLFGYHFVVHFPVWFLLYYLLLLVSFAWSPLPHTTHASHEIGLKTAFLIFPVVLRMFPLSTVHIKWVNTCFLIGFLPLVCWVIFQICRLYLKFGEINMWYLSNTVVPFNKNYFSYHLTFIWLLLWLGQTYFHQYVRYFFLFLISSCLLLLLPKAVLAFLALIFLYRTINKDAIRISPLVYFAVFGLVLLAILLISFPLLNSLEYDVTKNPYEIRTIVLNLANSASMRLVHWQAAWEIIQSNWIMGVGISDPQYHMDQQYIHLQRPDMVSYNSHNEFLGTWVKFGLLGPLILLGIFWHFTDLSIRKKSVMLFYWVAFLFLCMMIENVICTRKGIVLFSFTFAYLAGINKR